jgi:hypothetical protein
MLVGARRSGSGELGLAGNKEGSLFLLIRAFSFKDPSGHPGRFGFLRCDGGGSGTV